MARIFIEYDDGVEADWVTTKENAEIFSKLAVALLGSPDTIKC